MDKEKVYNEAVGGDEGFAAGDGYPSCDGEPCANVTDESSADADTMAGDRNTPKAASEELPSRDWEAEIAEWQDKYLRLQAEFDNFRKRTLREKMELVQSGSAECVKNFLPLMDDLQRALEAIEKSNDVEALREGVKLIAQKFRETLKKQNVKEIEALGLELDTDHHEAVARFQAGEEKKGKIVDVVQPGYKMGDKVLRFAKVVVGE
jgi:grpE